MGKKLISILAGILIGGNAMAYEVGDRMPTIITLGRNYSNIGFGGNWHSKDGSKKGTFLKLDKKDVKAGLAPNHYYLGDGKPDYMEVRLECDGEIMRNPFGVSDFNLELVYLDLNMDGYIDKIISNKNRSVEDDTPNCPKN